MSKYSTRIHSNEKIKGPLSEHKNDGRVLSLAERGKQQTEEVRSRAVLSKSSRKDVILRPLKLQNRPKA